MEAQREWLGICTMTDEGRKKQAQTRLRNGQFRCGLRHGRRRFGTNILGSESKDYSNRSLRCA